MRPTRLLFTAILTLAAACSGPTTSTDKEEARPEDGSATPAVADAGKHEASAEEKKLPWPVKEACKVVSTKPGWQGCTEITTPPGYWKDTDGVEPAIAGCHTLHGDDATCGAAPTNRIGEFCYDFERTLPDGTTQNVNWLVETNPDPKKCHPHQGGVGHPDVFDCLAFCKGTPKPGTDRNWGGGDCEKVPAFDCAGESVTSAICTCTDTPAP